MRIKFDEKQIKYTRDDVKDFTIEATDLEGNTENIPVTTYGYSVRTYLASGITGTNCRTEHAAFLRYPEKNMCSDASARRKNTG